MRITKRLELSRKAEIIVNDICLIVVCAILGVVAGKLIGAALWKLYEYIEYRRKK